MDDRNINNNVVAPPADIPQHMFPADEPVHPTDAQMMTNIPPMPDAMQMQPDAEDISPAPPSPDAMPEIPDNMQPRATAVQTMHTPDRTPMRPNDTKTEDCDYKSGRLPSCAPLAAAFVPFQQENPPKYSALDALTHGTLFPGLDLPFMNVANRSNPYAGTPLGEVMALDFVCHELKLYLDTHKDDKDAFEMLKSVIKLSGEAHRRYETQYGPLTASDLERADSFTWVSDPWPWEYSERRK